MSNKTTTRRVLILYLCDLGVTLLSLSLARALRVSLPFGLATSPEGVSVNLAGYAMVGTIWTAVFLIFSVYSPNHIARLADEIRTVSLAVMFSTLSLTGVLYLSFRGLSRLLFFYFFALDWTLLVFLRLAGRIWPKKMAANHQQTYNVLIVGVGPLAQQLAQALLALPWVGLRVVGYVQDTPGGPAAETGDLPVLGPMEQIQRVIAEQDVHEVIFTSPRQNRDAVARLLASLEEKPINVRVVPDLIDMAVFHATVDEVDGIPLIGLKGPVLDEYQRLVKRVMDLLLAGLSLIVCSPLLLACAVAIRLDSPGPVFFRQERVGENGRLFWMFKFRTMVPGADKDEHKFIQHNAEGKLVFRKTADDPRVTRIGRCLRRYSLDELPQLLNVLRGEMSLVGPRPELPALMELYQTGQRKRLCVTPGLTGWWQISGRSDRDKLSQVESDLYYLQNYSLWLDLKILWKTIGVVLKGEGAY
jgi:exopolysaccharide biosynthesis polyprenyl glycosylphosphotransferase